MGEARTAPFSYDSRKGKQAQEVVGSVFLFQVVVLRAESSDKCSSKHNSASESCVLLRLPLFILPYSMCATIEYKKHTEKGCRTESDLQMSKDITVTYAMLNLGISSPCGLVLEVFVI